MLCKFGGFFLDYANKSIYCAECIWASLSNSKFILFAAAYRKKHVWATASLLFLADADKINFRIA